MPIAVSTDVKLGRIAVWECEKVRDSVTEEDYSLCIGVHFYGFSHIDIISVRIGKYENFHF